MLARAFQDDPAFGWIMPDPAVRRARLPALFALFFAGDSPPAGARWVINDGEAATLWQVGAQPGFWQSLPGLFHGARALGGAMWRGLAVSRAIDAHFPEAPVQYLHIAGCDPAAQGRGLGAAAVRAGFGLTCRPIYLETATEANLGFYAGLGFRVTGEWRVGRDGPLFWSMMRDAA